MHIAFCDNNISFLNHLSKMVREHLHKLKIKYTYQLFDSTSSLVLSCQNNRYDAIFLNMSPTQNGVSAATKIQRFLPKCIFIFVSEYIEFATEGYYVNTLRYILKSKIENILPDCMKALLHQLNVNSPTISLYVNGQTVQRALYDILYFEGAQHFVIVNYLHSTTPKEIASKKLFLLEQELSTKGFLRIQKSFLVNMSYITSLRNYKVYLCTGEQLNVSEKNFSKIKQEFLLWKSNST